MALQDEIKKVKSEGGFDESDLTVKGWLLDRLRLMVSEAGWRLQEVTVGSTVAGEARYALTDDAVDLKYLKVGNGRFDPISFNTLEELKAGRATLVGPYGAYAPAFDAAGASFLELFPAPVTSGDAIVGLMTMQVPDLALDAELPIPKDLVPYVRKGAVAEGLALIDERLNEADRWEAQFADGIRLLQKRRNSRIGSGPVQIQVAGYHVRY